MTVLGAEYRDGETTEAAIQFAAAMAFRQAMQKAGTLLLEPIMKLEVLTPENFVGNVSADLNSRRAIIVNTELRANLVVIDAEAPLAMMFGYLLTHDTSQQKIFLFQGAPRSGKGTICRVLREMLGHSNVAGPSLSSLCGEFGLWPLVGKSVAIIPDAHSGRGSDATRVLEVIKSISGEDAMDINRKHRDQQTMRLSVRFLIACNSMLDLPDPSGALAGRLILFPFSRSFQGKEDHGLETRLLDELPGILRWSLTGLRALRANGRLIQPKSGEQVRADFARLSSPIRGFIDERMKVDPAGSVLVQDAYNAWRAWCEQEGHQPGASSSFGAKLLSAAPGITKHRPGSRVDRQWAYSGISLLRSDETLGHAWTRVTA